MKKIILVIGALCLLANLLFGGMISAYEKFNVGLNCGVIVVNTLLIYLTAAMRLKDGYKIPLSGLFGPFGPRQKSFASGDAKHLPLRIYNKKE